MFGNITITNNSEVVAENVFVNLPIPNFIIYVTGSLKVDGILQSDAADSDPGQADQNAVSAIWAEVAPDESHTISFQLIFKKIIDFGFLNQ